METNRRLMLMIDGDNAEAALLPQILNEVEKHGVIKIRRIYGDWGSPHLKSWKELLHTYALKAEQQFNYSPGKNATDIALVTDAMDLVHTVEVDGICIVSSDSDYTPLVMRVREKGLFVMGIGRKTTPQAFVKACNVFVYTEKLTSNTKATQPKSPSPASKPEDKPVPVNNKSLPKKLFRKAVDASAPEDGWVTLSAFGSALRQIDPAFNPRTYGQHKQLSQLVQAHPSIFEIEKRPNKNGKEAVYIRLKG